MRVYPVVVFAFVVSQALLFGIARAEDDKKTAQAQQLVHLALEAEANSGDSELRNKHLLEAIAESSEFAPAHWQRGEIYRAGSWQSMDDVAARSAGDRNLSMYEKQRSGLVDTELGNLRLAAWCASRKLGAQCFAHLQRVLDINPQNRAARLALGFRETEVGWISPDQFKADVRFAMEENESLERYGAKLKGILKQLLSPGDSAQGKGKHELLEIRDPEAVAAIEKIISAAREDLALLAIKVIDEIKGPAATRSLARHAIFHPSPRVRDNASDALKKRDPQGWAPGVVDSLRNPIDLTSLPKFDASGALIGLRHLFKQEGRYSNDVFVADTAYQRHAQTHVDSLVTGNVVDDRSKTPITPAVTVVGKYLHFNARVTEAHTKGNIGNAPDIFGNSDEQIAQELRIQLAANQSARDSRVATTIKNRMADELNERVYQALDKVEGKKIGNSPKEYWSWWNERKYWRAPSFKGNRYSYSSNTIHDVRHEYVTVYGTQTTTLTDVNQVIGSVCISCLTPHTIVWTQCGATPIKDVHVGDLVFCKNIATGQLGLSPVVRTTISEEPLETISFTTSGDKIECTKGHEFFVSGKGWLKACDLKAGDALHGASGPVKIDSISPAEKEMVHNLVVAGASNYFVGEGKILSHDFSERAENFYLVPGLEPKVE